MKKSKFIRIFITGGSGFLGSNLISYLLKKNGNYLITAITRDKTKIKSFPYYRDERIKWVEQDIVSLKPTKKEYDYFFHLACPSAEETFRGIDPLKKFLTIVEGTKRALEFAKVSKVKKFIFTSSGSVYGDYSKKYKYVPESYIPTLDISDPNNILGFSKTTAEFLCLNYSYKNDFKVCILRCFSFIGKNLPLNLHYAVGNFIKQAIIKKSIVIEGPADTYRSYLNVNDFCEWFEKIIFDESKNLIYNLGSEKSISMLDLARRIGKILDYPVKIICKNNKAAIGNLYRKFYLPDITLLKKDHSVKESFSLDSSLLEIINQNVYDK